MPTSDDFKQTSNTLHVERMHPKQSAFDDGGLPDGTTEVDAYSVARKRMVRKIDLRILPLVLITYGLQWLDKAILGLAAVYSLREDNHLKGDEYSWVGSVFYFSVMVLQFPLMIFLRRFSFATGIGMLVAAWGLCLTMTNFSSSFAGLVASRLVLGGLESPIGPAMTALIGEWYTRDEQPLRQIAWFSGIPTFGIFAGLINYGIGEISNPIIASWRIIYILVGCFTFCWGFFLFFVFPKSPAKARFLNEEERAIASAMHSDERPPWRWSQVREALLDPKTYLFLCLGFATNVPSGAITNFSSLLIKGFGFSPLKVQLLNIPSHVIQLASLILAGFIATKVKNSRLVAMSLCNIPCIIGTALVRSLPDSNRWGRTASLWIVYTNTVSLGLSFSVISGNVLGYAKKTTVSVFLFIGYCVGNIVAPQFFHESEAEDGYPTGITAMLASFSVLLVLPLILRVLYVWENKRRDRMRDEEPELYAAAVEVIDPTDMEDKTYRYVL